MVKEVVFLVVWHACVPDKNLFCVVSVISWIVLSVVPTQVGFSCLQSPHTQRRGKLTTCTHIFKLGRSYLKILCHSEVSLRSDRETSYNQLFVMGASNMACLPSEITEQILFVNFVQF